MLTLALDTTTKGGSVAILRGDVPLAIVQGDTSRTHGERLPGELDAALRLAGLSPHDVELIAVACGPGAFTGLRIGLAAVQGMAMVIGCPVVGVSALDALALAALDADTAHAAIATWMDAERGEVFAAMYASGQQERHAPRAQDAPIVGRPQLVLQSITSALAQPTLFIGNGAVRYQSVIVDGTAGQARVLAAPDALTPLIARIGQRVAQRGQAGPPHALQPLYVRRPDVELARGSHP